MQNIRGLSHDEYERVNMKLPEILPHIGYLPEQQVMLSGVLHTRLEVWLMMLERQNEVFQLLRTDDKTPQQCVQQVCKRCAQWLVNVSFCNNSDPRCCGDRIAA